MSSDWSKQVKPWEHECEFRCWQCGSPLPEKDQRLAGCASLIVSALVLVIVFTPLLWLARVALQWAL